MSATQPSDFPQRPLKSLLSWRGFVHLLARFYMNYYAAIERASRRDKHRAADVDVQLSADGTMWALHWGTVGKNKLHDPRGEIKSWQKIRNLNDAQIRRLKGPRGQKTHTILELLLLAYRLNKVRIELELKVVVPEETLRKLLANEKVAWMNAHGKLQFKTLAKMSRPIRKLRNAHNAGGTTILSFTDYTGKGISKAKAWPVTDYTRGKPKWVA